MIIASSAALRQASSNHQIHPLSSCHHDPQTAQNLEHDHDQYLWWSWQNGQRHLWWWWSTNEKIGSHGGSPLLCEETSHSSSPPTSHSGMPHPADQQLHLPPWPCLPSPAHGGGWPWLHPRQALHWTAARIWMVEACVGCCLALLSLGACVIDDPWSNECRNM